MTFESDLDTTIKGADPAIGSRVFPGFAPVGTQRPYVTYQGIGGGVVNLIDNTIPNVRKPDIQVNVWADTQKEAKRIALAIEAAMHAATAFTATRYADHVWDFDAELKRYGTKQDFCCKYHT